MTTRIIGEYSIDLREARDNKTLLEYHYNVIYQGWHNAGNYYADLRKGLKEYFEKYLTEGYLRLTDRMAPTELINVLDFGAGEGHVASWFKRRFPHSNVMTLDRPGTKSDIEIDFEENPDFYVHKYEDTFSVIILSEVLHCKSILTNRYILDTCNKMLTKKGKLIIVEPIDFVMAYRIGKIKDDRERHILDEWHIQEMMPLTYQKVNQIQIQKHKFYVYAKV